MVCQKCGKEIDENLKFCNECGAETEAAIDFQISETDNTEETDFDLDSLKKKLGEKVKKFVKNNKLFTITGLCSLVLYFLADLTNFSFLETLCAFLGLVALSDFAFRRVSPEKLKEQFEMNDKIRNLRNNPEFKELMRDINNDINKK